MEQSEKVVTWSENSEVIEYKQNDAILANNSHELDNTVEYSDLPEKELNLQTPELKAIEFDMEKLLGDDRLCGMCMPLLYSWTWS